MLVLTCAAETHREAGSLRVDVLAPVDVQLNLFCHSAQLRPGFFCSDCAWPALCWNLHTLLGPDSVGQGQARAREGGAMARECIGVEYMEGKGDVQVLGFACRHRALLR